MKFFGYDKQNNLVVICNVIRSLFQKEIVDTYYTNRTFTDDICICDQQIFNGDTFLIEGNIFYVNGIKDIIYVYKMRIASVQEEQLANSLELIKG